MSLKLQEAFDFVEEVKRRWAHDASVRRQFVHVLLNWGGPETTEDVALSLQVLLSGHPDLQLRLNRFLPERCWCTPFFPL